MSWPVVRITEVARVVGGATPKTDKNEFWGGEIAWATPKDLSDLGQKSISQTGRYITSAGLKSCAAEVLPKGSVLFSSRAPIGHVAVNEVPMATNQGFKSFIPSERLDASFLYWWLDANRVRLQAMGTGATFKEVSKAVVEKIEIQLPPLEEQKRIAEILEQADALRRLRARALEKLNTLGHAVFQEMFGGLSFDTMLSSVTVKITDGTHAAPEWSQTHEVPFLFVSSIKGQNIDFNTGKSVTENEYASLMRRTDLSAGDILYTCVGSYGNTAIVPESAKFVFQRHIAHIKPKPDLLTSEYLSFALESPSARAQADKTATGIAQKTMTLKALRELKIPLAPIDLQQEFSCRITQIKEQTKKIENVLQHEGALFSSLQSAAFQGKL